MEMNLKKYIYNWITFLYTWNTGNSTIFQSLKLFKKICHWTSNQLCFPCLFPLPTGRNPKYPKTEETFSQAGAGHGLFTNEVWWVFFASISASLKSSSPSWKAVACVCVWCVFIHWVFLSSTMSWVLKYRGLALREAVAWFGSWTLDKRTHTQGHFSSRKSFQEDTTV